MNHIHLTIVVFCFVVAQLRAPAIAGSLELAGVTVTPHVQSSQLRWRRPPDPQRGVRAEVFLRNPGPDPVQLDGPTSIRCDGHPPSQWVATDAWSWHDTPEVWDERAVQVPPETLTVLSFNTRTDAWGVGTEHALEINAENPLALVLASPDIYLSAVTFRGMHLAEKPTSFVVYVANERDEPVRMKACRVWLPDAARSRHVFRQSAAVLSLRPFTAEGVIAAREKGGFEATCQPLPLTYGVIEVCIALAGGEERSLFAHLRIKPEVFDISGGWVAGDVQGRNSLTLEPYLKTLRRMHINTGHIGAVPGYTDNDELYARYPLKLFNRLTPFDQFDNPQVLPRIHAVEFLGEPQYGGGRPVPPQEVWQELAPYQATRLPTTVTHSEERIWRYYAGLSDYPHYDAYRVTAPAADAWSAYERWNGETIRWGAPLETIGDLTRSLRDLNRPRPIAYWSQGAHAGWGRWRGRARSAPTPDELRSQAYHALGQRITSLYWFNLSLESLVAFPDLIEPITRVNREIRLIDRILLDGDAYQYRREMAESRPDWDLSSVVSPDAALLMVNDLSYVADMQEGVFRFPEARAATLQFRLPEWLHSPAEVCRVDADGVHDVPYSIDVPFILVQDRVRVAGMYVAAREAGWRARLQQLHEQLLSAESAVDFDPGNNDADQHLLRELLSDAPPCSLQGTEEMSPSEERRLTYAIVVTGRELLTGIYPDGHTHFLTRTLRPLGLDCVSSMCVDDRIDDMKHALTFATARADFVIVTGGLGPTDSDVTAEALSAFSGIALAENQDVVEDMARRFNTPREQLRANLRRQARVPVRGTYLKNPHGSAVGLVFDADPVPIVALPGPPRELQPMVVGELVPYLAGRYGIHTDGSAITIRFFGVGQSQIDQTMKQHTRLAPDITQTSQFQGGRVDFTFALPQNRPEDRTRLEALRAELHQHLGDYIYADDEATTLEDCVAAPLVARGQTMALAEIGSGGGLAAALSHIAAAEEVLTGAFAAPSVERLRHVLQVPDDTWRGAQPSDQLALLARHAAQQAGGDWSVAVGPPEEDPPTRAAYLTMCVRQPDGTTRTSRHRWPGASSAAQDYMISEILDTLRRTIR